MNAKIISITIITWIIFMFLAIINAGIRNRVYKPIVGNLTAHQISTLLFTIIIFVVTYLVFHFNHLEINDSEALIMGSIWLIFTIGFEFVAGHYIFGNSWETLFADYNLLKGRIWSFVLITTFLAPFLTHKLV